MSLPLNVYKTLTGTVSTNPEIIYTAPIGYTGVVLLGQVANKGLNTEEVLFSYVNSESTTEVFPSGPVSSNDAVKLFSGKLLVLSGESLELSVTNSTDLKYTFSILETLN
jgi:hypothetical protein